jgi:hypothetical protein
MAKDSEDTIVVDLSGSKNAITEWTTEKEDLLADWADVASCYRWMHNKVEKQASINNMWITIPVIVLSTLSGSASFMLNSITGNEPISQKYGQIGIGTISIFTGIITTLGNFLRYAQNSEANRVASIAWGKFHRQISIELALHPSERIDSIDFLKICRSELDRLIEQSPQIPDSIIKDFEKEFERIPNLQKPDIANGLERTKIYRVATAHADADADEKK